MVWLKGNILVLGVNPGENAAAQKMSWTAMQIQDKYLQVGNLII